MINSESFGVEGLVWCHGRVSPSCCFWILPKRSIPKPDQHRRRYYTTRLVRHWYVV